MPDTVRIVGRVPCANCDRPLLDAAVFQWGAVPGWECDLGKEAIWVRNDDNRPYFPFVVVFVDGKYPMYNIGDPRCANVVLLDEQVYSEQQALSCPDCGIRVAAVTCTVQDGIYQSMNAVDDAGLAALIETSRGKANCVVVMEDGSLMPREDWYDMPLKDARKIAGDVTISLSELPEILR